MTRIERIFNLQMDETAFFGQLLRGWTSLALILVPVLLWIPAPYGKLRIANQSTY